MTDSNMAGVHGPIDGYALLAALENTAAPELLARKLGGEAVRIWLPGCASGKMAYAVASVVYSLARRRDDAPAIQIFATDDDPQVIEEARYDLHADPPMALGLPGIAPERFLAGQTRLTKATLRHLITFAEHHALRDPPFANLNVIVCSGLLARFSTQERQQILHRFHWSLRPDGYLLLGTPILGTELSQLFFRHSREPALFQRRGLRDSKAAWHISALPARPPDDGALQAANQQLLAMNQELRRKVGQLAQANDDLSNLLRSTNLATVFLDRDLRIARFTAPAQQIFNLILADLGRPLAHITHTLAYPDLAADAAGVLATLQSVEREVGGAGGCWYMARLHPYRTGDERVAGVVLTLLDISARVQAEAELRRAHAELERRVQERTAELSAANHQLRIEIAERERLEQERTELLRRLVTMQEDERRRIARELHDQLGQSITALSLGLANLANPALEAEPRQQILAQLQLLAAQIDQDMGRLAMNLRPTALDDLGLIPAVQNHIERWSVHTGIAAEFQAIGLAASRLPPEIESVIYRVIQETLTNVLKHAGAGHVSVIVERRPGQARVIVEDNGRGFDPEALQQTPNVRRLGLLGMRERVALVGGTLSIESALGAGTTLFVQLPIDPESPTEPGDR